MRVGRSRGGSVAIISDEVAIGRVGGWYSEVRSWRRSWGVIRISESSFIIGGRGKGK